MTIKNNNLLASLAVAIGLSTLSVYSAAATMTFDARAAFLAAGNSPSSTGIDIVQVGGSGLVPSASYSSLIPAGWAISGEENFDISITTPSLVYGFGMDVHEPIEFIKTLDGCNWATCEQSTFTVKLFNGAILIDEVTFEPADDQLAFFGVTSDTYFNRLEIRETIGSADNEIFGNFVTTASPVPLPAAAWLFGSALLGLVTVARRKAAPVNKVA